MYSKTRLSQEQLRRYLTCAREMQAGGCSVRIPEDWMERSPVEIKRAGRSAQVCENEGLICYVIPVQIVANGRVNICDYQLYSEFERQEIQLLYLRQKNGRCRWGSVDHGFEEVLNNQFESGFRLNFRGEIKEGVLVAHGGEFPEQCCMTQTVTVHVTLIDSLGRRSAKAAIGIPLVERGIKRKKTEYVCAESATACDKAVSPVREPLIVQPPVTPVAIASPRQDCTRR